MKQLMMSLIIFVSLTGIANASLKYECSRYVNGDYQGYTYVVANNKSDAENKAYYPSGSESDGKAI